MGMRKCLRLGRVVGDPTDTESGEARELREGGAPWGGVRALLLLRSCDSSLACECENQCKWRVPIARPMVDTRFIHFVACNNLTPSSTCVVYHM